MALRIPKNKIKVKYTSGGEYVIANSNIRYQGYYCELNGKAYTGKEFNAPGSLPLIKLTPELSKQLLFKPNTALYGVLSKIKFFDTNVSSLAKLEDINTDYFSPEDTPTTYYAKKINSNIIKEINQETFNKLQLDPLYIVVSLEPYYANLELAEKTMPGLTDFLYKI
jgi:hypothetical protein